MLDDEINSRLKTNYKENLALIEGGITNFSRTGDLITDIVDKKSMIPCLIGKAPEYR